MAGGSRHPFYVRCDQRQAIRDGHKPETLIQEAAGDGLQQLIRNMQLSATVESALRAFCEPNSKVAEQWVILFTTRVDPASLNLLAAFLDQLLDFEPVSVFQALSAHHDRIVPAMAGVIRKTDAEVARHSFLLRVAVLLYGAALQKNQVREVAVQFIQHIGRLWSDDCVLPGLRKFLCSDVNRAAFAPECKERIVPGVTAAMRLAHTDTLYQWLFIAWQMTFNSGGAEVLSDLEFVSVLQKLLTQIQPEREDVVRLLTAIVAQLNQSRVFVEHAYDCDILRLFRGFQGRPYVEKATAGEVKAAADRLNQELKRLSLWEKYVREVKSKKLHMSQMHRSEAFWKANIERFGDGQFAVVEQLKELLGSDDGDTVVVALHDLGEFASRHPGGRVKCQELGAKSAVLQLLASPNRSVQSEALRTTQLLLLKSTAQAGAVVK